MDIADVKRLEEELEKGIAAGITPEQAFANGLIRGAESYGGALDFLFQTAVIVFKQLQATDDGKFLTLEDFLPLSKQAWDVVSGT